MTTRRNPQAFLAVVDQYARPLTKPHHSFDIPADLSNLPTFTSFYDGFENAMTFTDIFREDLSRWHNAELIPPETNTMGLDPSYFTGQNRLKCYTAPTINPTISKAQIWKELLHFTKGDHVWYSSRFFIETVASVVDLYLMDLEDSQSAGSQGRRIYVGGDGAFRTDGKDLAGPVYHQTPGQEIAVPIGRYFTLQYHIFLSEGDDGLFEIWQDGVKIIEAHGQNLPTPTTVYDRLQTGITANASLVYPQTVYMDYLCFFKG